MNDGRNHVIDYTSITLYNYVVVNNHVIDYNITVIDYNITVYHKMVPLFCFQP